MPCSTPFAPTRAPSICLTPSTSSRSARHSSPCRASSHLPSSSWWRSSLWLIMRWTDTGKAIRAVAKEKLGAELSGIDVAHIYAVTFGLGTACLAIAACLLIPTYYVNPTAGNAFVLIAFTIVVLGGMGSVPGALLGGLFVGVVESLSGSLSRGIARPDRHLRDVHPGAAVPPERAVRRARMKGLAPILARCGAARRRAADHVVQRRAQFPGHGAADRAGRPGLEPARRLWRPVFVRPCGVLRHRRLCHRDPANALRRQRLAGICHRHRRRCAGRRRDRRARASARGSRARISRSSRWPSPRCCGSSPASRPSPAQASAR